MVRILAIGLLATLVIGVTGSSASEQVLDSEDSWRETYEGKDIPMDALADFDEVAERLGDLASRLEDEGKLDASGKAEIVECLENMEEEFMDRWFGDEGKFTIRFDTNSSSSQSTNNNYDREFREQTRSSFSPEKRVVEDSTSTELGREIARQELASTLTPEMVEKQKQLANLMRVRNEIIVALIDVINERAGTQTVPPGRHIMKLAINQGTRNLGFLVSFVC